MNRLKSFLKQLWFTQLVFRWLEKVLHVYWLSTPLGHYYSPIPNSLDRETEQAWSAKDTVLGVKLNDAYQTNLLDKLLFFWPEYEKDIFFKENMRYRVDNGYFSGMDAFVLYALIRMKKPRKIIEVGSGYSSALMLDTNELSMEGRIRHVFIDPFADRLRQQLRPEDMEQVQIVEKKVQEVDLSLIADLQKGDFLFIDSSHVSKAGSDLNYILFEILPCLNEGVWIHFHDIFWPFTYPQEWFGQGRFWNEAYLLRAFLQSNSEFEIRLFNDYLLRHAVASNLKLPAAIACDASSLWIEKINSPNQSHGG